MSNVSIYEKNWTDLVFEDKNKAYGAYQLRQENPRTSLLAFIVALLFIFSLIGSWMLLSSFGAHPDDELPTIPLSETITPVDLSTNVEKEPFRPEVEQAQPQMPNETPDLSRMVVAATTQAVDNVPTNDNLPTHQDNTTGTATGTTIDAPTNVGSSTGITTPTAPSGPIASVMLDKLPEYPGGIKKFYEYVGNSIEKSEIENNSSSVSVIMSFVIERDGTMTDIKVLRSSDKALEREAIRVLKALRVKWAPGYLDGEKVRTQYTLPIKVAI